MTSPVALPGFMLRDLRGASKVRSLWVFCSCLFLGITLIASCGSLLRIVQDGFTQQERNLFGGDLRISQRQAANDEQLNWLSENGRVSRLVELRTMLGTASGDFTVVELQSVDDEYPLYGNVLLEPSMTLQSAVSQSDNGVWGAAFDPALLQQLSLEVGQLVSVGSLELELRAVILEQPDRSLRADFRGPPIIVDVGALQQSGLLSPTSLVDYDYRIRTDENPNVWRETLRAAFPDASWEVQTVDERSEIVGRRLNQVASVLLMIGFSTLLIGGLGVGNSVGAYLQTKLHTLATLQSLGARSAQVASIYIGQIILLAAIASIAGALTGAGVAWFSAKILSEQLPIMPSLTALTVPTMLAIILGICMALVFALPILGRTLNMPVALLIKGISADSRKIPASYLTATIAISISSMLLLLMFVPEPLVATGFIVLVVLLLLSLEAIVKLIRMSARKFSRLQLLEGHFALRLAVTGLYRPSASLRPMLLSLGTALTLLVASAFVIASTYQALGKTVPEEAPSLVFYDLQKNQVDGFNSIVVQLDGYEQHAVAPLVLGRLTSVNGLDLAQSTVASRALEANDEHKLSYRLDSIDNPSVDRGEWWPSDYAGPTLVAMEDREADQLGLHVGDQLVFNILGETVDATLSAIYSQARFETSFWLEAVFTDTVLDPFITRYIGSVRLDTGADIAAQSTLGEKYPNVVTVRTAKVLESSRSILSAAGLAMTLITAVSLCASVLVMTSVVAVNRQRQVYEATVLHAMGTRTSVIMKSVMFEYGLLAVLLSVFSLIVGSLLAQSLMSIWLKIDSAGSLWVAFVVAIGASSLCLFAGALWLVFTLKASPALLLKRGT